VRDPEALLLVHDQEAEVVEFDIAGEEAMGANDDVHLARFPTSAKCPLIRARAKPADHVNLYGKRREAPAKRLVVLESQHGGGRKNNDLLRVEDGFEGGAHGHFVLP